MKKRFLLLVTTFGVAITAASFNLGGNHASATVTGTNTLVSHAYSSSSTAGNVYASNPMLSANGKYVAYTSGSSNLISSDTNGYADIFEYNVATGSNALVSISSASVQGNDNSSYPKISETGRYIVFMSRATNLIDGTTSPLNQMYLRDTVNNTTVLISKNPSGSIANAAATPFGVSADGRFVVFTSTATNLNSTATDGKSHYYLIDLSNNTNVVLDTKYDGTVPSGNNAEMSASMSCDGSITVFVYGAQLTTQSTSHYDVYLFDARDGNRLTDLTASANGATFGPSVSCDGNYIGFGSPSTNLDPAFTSNSSWQNHAFMYDRINNSYQVVDKDSSGNIANTFDNDCLDGFDNHCIALSDDGVALFTSTASNLAGVSTDQTYIRNTQTGVTELLSQNSSGAAGNGVSYLPQSISKDGEVATYGSVATNLVSGTDTNTYTDVFTSVTGH